MRAPLVILPGHTEIESTVRCFGVDVEDALSPAKRTEVQRLPGFPTYRAGSRLDKQSCAHVGQSAEAGSFEKADNKVGGRLFDQLSHPPVGVPGSVADDIRLGLNNTTAGNAIRQLPHQYLANEIAGERDRINRQLRASEWRMAILTAAMFQGIRSTHCAREGPGSNGSPKYWVSRATFPSRNSMMLTV